MQRLTVDSRNKLQGQIALLFDLDEISSLCMSLEIDFENIQGNTKIAKSERLVQYLDQREKIHELTQLLKASRPNANWDVNFRDISAEQAKVEDAQLSVFTIAGGEYLSQLKASIVIQILLLVISTCLAMTVLGSVASCLFALIFPLGFGIHALYCYFKGTELNDSQIKRYSIYAGLIAIAFWWLPLLCVLVEAPFLQLAGDVTKHIAPTPTTLH